MATVLAVLEGGGCPSLGPIAGALGLEPRAFTTVRKALAAVKAAPADVVVAEFVYAPTYGARESSLESLVAALQRAGSVARLIVLARLEDRAHLDRIRPRFPIFDTLYYPVSADALRESLRRALASAR